MRHFLVGTWAVAALIAGATGCDESVLVDSTCGNGEVESGEECDDGNADDTDVCTNTCAARKVVEIATGSEHACALTNGGVVKCWGNNADGRLGLGDTASRGDEPGEMGDSLPAVDLGTGMFAVAIGAGDEHTCAVLNDGSVKCWGRNDHGQLGLGDTESRGDQPGEMGDNLPAVDLGTGKTAVLIRGGGGQTCAVLNDGTVKCWGRNDFGQLGLGDTKNRGDSPGQMGDGLPVVDLGSGKTAAALGASHQTCALLTNGSVRCWGLNNYGQLGQGDTENRGDSPGQMGDALSPVTLAASGVATEISAGNAHTCALLQGGTVKCWGRSNVGQVGLGDKEDRGDEAGEMGGALPAIDLGAAEPIASIRAGYAHTCALTAGGAVKCWAYNHRGQLGRGDTADRGDETGEMGNHLSAVDLGSGKSAVAIHTGATSSYTCALLNEASVKCWGANDAGQLGLGDTESRGDQPGEMGDDLPAVGLFPLP